MTYPPMHTILASLEGSQKAPYSPPLVRIDSTFTRSDLWRSIPEDKQKLLKRKGGLSDVKPIATDGTHFLALDPYDGHEHVGHVTNLIEEESFLAFMRPKKEKAPKAEKPLPKVSIDLSFMYE